jgi:hypothetical protein
MIKIGAFDAVLQHRSTIGRLETLQLIHEIHGK